MPIIAPEELCQSIISSSLSALASDVVPIVVPEELCQSINSSSPSVVRAACVYELRSRSFASERPLSAIIEVQCRPDTKLRRERARKRAEENWGIVFIILMACNSALVSLP